MLRPSSLLALLTVRHHQLAPEDVLHPSLLSIRCLLDSQVCYPADWSIAGAGLSPARKAATVGCTIIELQWKQFGLLPEGHHQGGPAAHSAQRAAGMEAQLAEAGGLKTRESAGEKIPQ